MTTHIPKIHQLEKLLSTHLPEDVKISSYTAKRLTAPGENYGSTMLSLQVHLDNKKTLECVAKLIPNNEWLQKMFCIQESFKKEIWMYENIMPELIRFQKERGIPQDDIMDVLAKCLGARINLNPNSDVVDDDAVIILENLKSSGFKVGDRMSGFDLHTSKLILNDLAKFHAVPIAMKLLEKGRFEKKIEPFLYKVSPGDNFTDETGKQMAEKIFDSAKSNEECVQYLERCAEGLKLGEQFFRFPSQVGDAYGTIIHNDYWVNNTMIRLDDTENPKAVENKMVDFQFYSYGSAVRDLIFFLYTSVERPLINDGLDDLLQFYFHTFVECLRNLGCDVAEYTWESFLAELNQIAPTEFYHVIFMLRPVLALEKKVMNMEEMNENIMLQDDMVSDLYKKCLADTIITFAKKKWI